MSELSGWADLPGFAGADTRSLQAHPWEIDVLSLSWTVLGVSVGFELRGEG